eukprot:gene2280-1664_t
MEGANEDNPSAEPGPKVKRTRKRKVIAEESTIPDDSEDVATATAEGPKKKPRSTGASGKTATTALLDHLLPLQYYHLLLFFDLCDKMYCFLSKMNMKSSTENLTRMYGNLVSFSVLNDLEAWREFHPQNLVAVCAFCPSDFLLNDFQVSKEELRLEGGPVTATESRTLLEFTFKRFLGIGKGNIDKRRKLLLEAMTRYVIEHFLRSEAASESFANVSHGEVIASINDNGWPETFDVHSCPLPDDKVINEQASLRKARQLLGLGSPLTQKASLLSKVEQGNSQDDSSPPVVCDDGFYENCAGALTYALAEIRKAAFYRGQIRHVRYFPSQRAVFGRLERPLPSVLQQRITDLYHIRHFYRHQAIAINAIRDGRHVMISTSTASGKSLVFNLPVVEQLLLDRDRGIASTALYLFPTKALAQDQLPLAQDQLRSLRQFLGPQLVTQVVPVVCDGDTPHGDRMDVMHGLGDIILTNPDMLHHTLLPEHKAWQRIFAHLRYIVLDEAHLYSGSFGTHVACVMRRVIRVCLAYNATSLPQFICCSATISNPLEHICSLLPLRVLPTPSRIERTTPTTAVEVAVETEGAGAGAGSAGGATSDASDRDGGSPPLASDSNDIDDVEEKEETIDDDDVEHAVLPSQVLWDDLNLAIVDHTMDGLDEKLLRTMSGGSRHVSIIFETAVLFAALITQRLRTIAFCKTRKLVELVYKYCVRELERSGGEHAALVPSVSSYRGGYTDEERRSIERELFAHRLLGVAATCALELGIDVGSLDVTMHMGFPGSFSSLWQQAGRAGRSGRASLSFIMCFECPVDQYFARFPEKLLSKDAIEPAVLDVDNLLILKSHVACAAKEIPLNFDFQYVTSSSSTATLATTLLSDHQLWGVNYGPAVDVLLEHYTLRPMRTKATGTLVTTSRFVNKGNTATHSSATVAATATADANNESNRQGQPLLMYWSSGSYAKNEAARQVNLRMIDPITISIVDDTQPAGSPRRTIDSMEYSRAFFELFENAIFLHRGQQFLVRHLDLAAHVAYTVPVKRRKLSLTEKIRRWQGQRQPMAHRLQQTTGTWPSQQQKSTSRHTTEAETAVSVSETTTAATSLVHYGVVQVVHRVFGYVKQWLRNGEIFEVGECSLPPLEYETTAVWVDLPVKLKHTLDRDLGICSIASMHAANHILLQCGALIGQSGCDVSDLGTEHDLSAEVRADTHPFRMLLYDKRPGGLGACANIFLCMQQPMAPVPIYANPKPSGSVRINAHNSDDFDDELPAAITSFDDDWWSPLPPSVPPTATSVTAAEPASAAPPPQPAPLAQDHVKKLLATISPTKQQRHLSLNKATIRDSVRSRGLAIQSKWTDAVPDFITDSHHQHPPHP